MRIPLMLTLPVVLIACTPSPEPVALPETSLPFFGDGYPEAGAPCRRVGESTETVEFLDHTADLIGCPETMSGLDDYVEQTGAEEVLRQDGYVLYSVPRGI